MFLLPQISSISWHFLMPQDPNILLSIMFVTVLLPWDQFHTCTKTKIQPAWKILIPMCFDREKEHLACTEETWKAHQILFIKPWMKGKETDERMILKWHLKKKGTSVWNGFISCRTRFSEYGNECLGSIKTRNYETISFARYILLSECRIEHKRFSTE